MSTFGTNFRVTTFGESHGKSVGVIIDGVPPKIALSEEDIQPMLDRRRPGQSRLTTERKEWDRCTILSGVCPFEKKTLGTSIAVTVNNEDQRSFDYANVDLAPRPGHADYTYQQKYGIRAKSGGGRASARETIGRCIAGAIAQKALNTEMNCPDVKVVTFVSQVGPCSIPDEVVDEILKCGDLTSSQVASLGTLFCRFDHDNGRLVEAFSVQDTETLRLTPCDEKNGLFESVSFKSESVIWDSKDDPSIEIIYTECPHPQTAASMADIISKCRLAKDSIGGITTTLITGLPAGLGEPVFDKFEAMLAYGMMSLPATKGFAIGQGFEASRQFLGSQHNDPFVGSGRDDTTLRTVSNHAGGTLGGITNGTSVYFRVAFKPVSSIGLPQKTADWNGDMTELQVKGRHDPCVLPRCPPLVDSMSLIVCADAVGLQRARGDALWPQKVKMAHAHAEPDEKTARQTAITGANKSGFIM